MAAKVNITSSHPKFVGIRFCRECNNMLYPKEDVVHKRLLYACRNCTYTEIAKNSCIYVNNLDQNYDELRCVNSDIIQDPALPRTKALYCPKCKNKEMVFFQSDNRQTIEHQMKLNYICTNVDCCHRWTQ